MKDLRDALHAVNKHERFISQKALEVIIHQQYEEEKPDILTATETEIVKAIAQGKTTKEIAEEQLTERIFSGNLVSTQPTRWLNMPYVPV